MSDIPLMPKSTAVWLVENTSLTFRQIAEFCHLHELEVKGIADGDVAAGVKGLDPITGGQLTRDEIEQGEKDTDYRLKLQQLKVNVEVKKATAGPRYTPVSRRGDRPDAIAWLLRYHPELADAAVMKLIGTTKHTINAIRDRSHWNATNIKPVDPVSLGICSQLDLDLAVQKAATKGRGKRLPDAEEVRTLIPAAEIEGTRASESAKAVAAAKAAAAAAPSIENMKESEVLDADSVFAKLKNLKLDKNE